MKPHSFLLCLVALGATSACDTDCDELQAIPVTGSYALQADLESSVGPYSEVVAATLEADDQQVMVEYERADGTRWKATYRITDRRIR